MSSPTRVQVGVGNVQGAFAELRDFANKVNDFGASLSAWGERRKKAEEDEFERLAAIEEITGSQLSELSNELNKRVRNGELHEGANPVNNIGRGVLSVQNAVAIDARGKLYAKINDLMTAEATPEQAQEFFRETMRSHTRPDMSKMEQLAFIQSAGSLQQEFLSKVTQGQLEARAQATRTQAAIHADLKLQSYSKEFSLEERVAFVQEQKQILDTFRSMGVKDTNDFYVTNVLAPHIETIGEADVDAARRLLEDIREMDVTGSGGKLGNIGPIKVKLERLERTLDQREFESSDFAALEKSQQQDKIHARKMLEGVAVAANNTTDRREIKAAADAWFETNYGNDPLKGLRRAQYEEVLSKFTDRTTDNQDIADDITRRLIRGEDPVEIQSTIQDLVSSDDLSPNLGLNLLGKAEVFASMRQGANEAIQSRIDLFTSKVTAEIGKNLAEIPQMRAAQVEALMRDEVDLVKQEYTENFGRKSRVALQNALEASGLPPQEFFKDQDRVERILDKVSRDLEPATNLKVQALSLKPGRLAPVVEEEQPRPGFFASEVEVAKYDVVKGINRESAISTLKRAEDVAMRQQASNPLRLLSDEEVRQRTEEQRRKEVMSIREGLGFKPSEILRGRTEKGLTFNPEVDVNPYKTLLFTSTEELKNIPDTTVMKMADALKMDKDELLVIQAALLRKLNK